MAVRTYQATIQPKPKRGVRPVGVGGSGVLTMAAKHEEASMSEDSKRAIMRKIEDFILQSSDEVLEHLTKVIEVRKDQLDAMRRAK